MADADDFERADSELGENWSFSGSGKSSKLLPLDRPWPRYRGFGMRADGQPFTGIRFRTDSRGETVSLYDASAVVDSMMPRYPPPNNFIQFASGYRVELTRHCAKCRKPWEKGDIAISQNAEPFRHADCSNPKEHA